MATSAPDGLSADELTGGNGDPDITHLLSASIFRDLLADENDGQRASVDAELLALRPEYERLRAKYVACSSPDVPDKQATPTFVAFDRFCVRVAQMPSAVTAEGRALQAVCVMHQLAYVANWRTGEEPTGADGLAWKVLAGQLGNAYPIPCTGRPL